MKKGRNATFPPSVNHNKMNNTAMNNAEEAEAFADALFRFVGRALEQEPDPVYSQKAVRIADARNHIFRLVDDNRTDEAEDLYALRDLCLTDEDLQTFPNRRRMLAIARNYW